MKILMVCLGNICRSPLAHGILESRLIKNNLHWKVDSCGTSGFHNGELPDSRSIDVANANGIDITNQRSRQLTTEDLDEFDLIVAMDSSNYQDILRKTTNETQKTKVKLLMNFAYPGENRAVPDPYYYGGFQKVFDMIEEAIDKLIIEYQS